MRVIVASKNPVKIAATKQAFDLYYKSEATDFIGVDTASGVSDQPSTIEETIQGAVNRAKNARNDAADYSVGIEGGVSFQTIDGTEHCVEISWCCVLDCQTGQYEIGSAPGFVLLPSIVERIRSGHDLSSALEAEYGIANAGVANGYIGWLSNDHIDRQRACYESVYLALCAVNKEEKK